MKKLITLLLVLVTLNGYSQITYSDSILEPLRIKTNYEYPDSVLNYYYQDDFFSPGIFPSLASSRRQIRHISNFLIYPGLLPQSLHLLYIFVGCFTFTPASFCCIAIFFLRLFFTTIAVLAIFYCFLNGKLNALSKALPCSSF